MISKKAVSVFHPSGIIKGKIHLYGSKSISNRALILNFLSGNKCTLYNISDGDDTKVLADALSNPERLLHNVKLAGTSGRFLTALFATGKGTQVIDAEEGLKKRPIQPLVNVLRQIGCSIDYIEEEGRFPIRLNEFEAQTTDEVTVPGNISSQFISALLLIAPTLPKGLKIIISDATVSRPYIDMTISMMEYFGIKILSDENSFTIAPQTYQPKELVIEGDWSSASYFFGIVAMAKEAEISISGLFENSWQGDARIVQMAKSFGVETIFSEDLLTIKKSEGKEHKPYLELDFITFPDLFQTVAVMTGAHSMHGVFTGLDTLPLKETDRISALQEELTKCGIFLNKMPEKFSGKKGKTIYFMEGNFVLPGEETVFNTYSDHRMAMSIAMLGVIGKVYIADEDVVTKSYPTFWKDLETLGFIIGNPDDLTQIPH